MASLQAIDFPAPGICFVLRLTNLKSLSYFTLFTDNKLIFLLVFVIVNFAQCPVFFEYDFSDWTQL